MIKNYLTIAVRNLARQTGYDFVNLAGLAVQTMGMTLVAGRDYLADSESDLTQSPTRRSSRHSSENESSPSKALCAHRR